MQVIKALLSSKKFVTMIVGIAAALAARWGFDLDTELVAAMIGLVAITIGAQGLADQGKEAAKEANRLPPALLVLFVIGASSSGALLSGCGATKGAMGRVAAGAIDCMTPTAKDAIAAFGPAISSVVRNATGDDGRVDWEPVKAIAAPLKTSAQRCVLAAVIAEALRPRVPRPDAPQSSPLQWDPVSLEQGFDEIRAGWGGPTFQLEGGAL